MVKVMSTYSTLDLEEAYSGLTIVVKADCEFVRELVGGLPAGRDGVELFVKYHLKLEGSAAEEAVNRILDEEVGEKDVTPEEGEVKEKESYGVSIIRSDKVGPFIGDWMVKANLKVAASRIGLFKTKHGTKGDFAEFARVRAIGNSLNGKPWAIHLHDKEGKSVATKFETLRGRVQTPAGPKSIVHDCQIVEPGALFSFEWRIPKDSKATEEDIVKTFAVAQQVGLGSARSLERGKYKILKLDIQESSKKKSK
jgi:hypothetical protein